MINRRLKIKYRIKKKVIGNKDMPRLSVFKSNKHFYVQLIDDTLGNTLVSVSSNEKKLLKLFIKKNKMFIINKISTEFMKRIKNNTNINKIVFDRNGYPYHGLIKYFAECLRNQGLIF